MLDIIRLISIFVTMFGAFTIINYFGNDLTYYITGWIYTRLRIQSQYLFINAYFIGVIIFTFFNLIASLLGATNIIIYNNTELLLVGVTGLHTMLCIVMGVAQKGLRSFTDKIFINLGNNILLFPLAVIIYILRIFMEVLIKTVVTAVRLILNVKIGHTMHHIIAAQKGYLLNFIIFFMKFGLYIIQTYIFYVMYMKMYYTFCNPDKTNPVLIAIQK